MIDPNAIDPEWLQQQGIAPQSMGAPTMAQGPLGGLGGLIAKLSPNIGQKVAGFGGAIRNALNPVDPSMGVDPEYAKAQQRLGLIRMAAGIAGGRNLAQGLGQGLDASNNIFQTAMENSYNNALKKKQMEDQQAMRAHQLEQDKLQQQNWQAGHDLAVQHLQLSQAEASKPKVIVKSEPLSGDASQIQDYLLNTETGEKKPIGKPYASPGTLKIGAATLTPEQNDALYGPNGAVTLGKLDPYKVNSRTAAILANAYVKNPDINMNALGATASLQRNSQFQQKAMTAETMPEILTGVANSGKKLNFSDAKFAGEVDKWLKGQSNNPDLIDYMTRRNDALFGIASVMRGNGVTDKAYQAEEEAAHPTMSPRALDAWLGAQMASLMPRLRQYRKVTGNGNPAAPEPPTSNGWSIKPVAQ